jgi:hypothetical protein
MADIDIRRRSWSAVWWILGLIVIILVLWMLLEAIKNDARVVLGRAGHWALLWPSRLGCLAFGAGALFPAA